MRKRDLDQKRLQFMLDHRHLMHEVECLLPTSGLAADLFAYVYEHGELTEDQLRAAAALVHAVTGRELSIETEGDHA